MCYYTFCFKRRYRIFNKLIIICLFVGNNLLASTVANFKTICNIENKSTKEFINNECFVYYGTNGINGVGFYKIVLESKNYLILLDKNKITLDNFIVHYKIENNLYIFENEKSKLMYYDYSEANEEHFEIYDNQNKYYDISFNVNGIILKNFNKYGKIFTIYLGNSCDVISKEYGKGNWKFIDYDKGTFEIIFNDKENIFFEKVPVNWKVNILNNGKQCK